jgi:hypothetical protein
MQVQLSFTQEFRYPDDSSGITIPGPPRRNPKRYERHSN